MVSVIIAHHRWPLHGAVASSPEFIPTTCHLPTDHLIVDSLKRQCCTTLINPESFGHAYQSIFIIIHPFYLSPTLAFNGGYPLSLHSKPLHCSSPLIETTSGEERRGRNTFSIWILKYPSQWDPTRILFGPRPNSKLGPIQWANTIRPYSNFNWVQ